MLYCNIGLQVISWQLLKYENAYKLILRADQYQLYGFISQNTYVGKDVGMAGGGHHQKHCTKIDL